MNGHLEKSNLSHVNAAARLPKQFEAADSLHSVREACSILSIGPTKCWELMSQGALEVVRLGARCTRIKRSSIDALIENGVSQAGGAQ